MEKNLHRHLRCSSLARLHSTVSWSNQVTSPGQRCSQGARPAPACRGGCSMPYRQPQQQQQQCIVEALSQQQHAAHAVAWAAPPRAPQHHLLTGMFPSRSEGVVAAALELRGGSAAQHLVQRWHRRPLLAMKVEATLMQGHQTCHRCVQHSNRQHNPKMSRAVVQSFSRGNLALRWGRYHRLWSFSASRCIREVGLAMRLTMLCLS